MKGNDLGRDSIRPLVLKLALPSMAAQLVNVLYGIVDRIYISALPQVGELALAGVGVSVPIVTLMTSFAALIGIGGAPLTAMRMGEGNQKGAQRILSNCTAMLSALALVMTAILYFFRVPLLAAFGASESLMPYAEPYLRYVALGTVFSLGAAGLNQFIICQGCSTAGMLTVVVGAVTNILLDPIFIFTLDMGCAGAAIATVLAQGASFAFVVTFLLSKRSQIHLSYGGLDFSVMKKVLLFGLSPFVILATDSIVIIALNTVLQTRGGSQGDALIACATITQSFMQLISMPLLGLSGGTQPLLSFNYGARKLQRIRDGERAIVKMGLVFTGLMFVLSQFFFGSFARIFAQDADLIDLSVRAMRVYTLCIVPLTFQYCFVDGFTALGVAKTAMCLSLFRKISMIALTCVLPLAFGAFAAFWAEPISDLLSSALSAVVFLRVFPRLMAKREAMGEGETLYG